MLIVLGSTLARADSVDKMRLIAQEHVARSRLEPGCLSHAVLCNLDDPLRLVFVERWSGWDALRAHFQLPASSAFVEDMVRLGAEPPEVAVYEATSSQTPLAPRR